MAVTTAHDRGAHGVDARVSADLLDNGARAATPHAPAPPSALGELRALWNARSLLWALTWSDLHARYTGSRRAQEILAGWADFRGKFVKVFPKEYRRALGELHAAREAAETIAHAKAPAASVKA